MAAETTKILKLVEQGVLEPRDAFLLFAALQGRPLPTTGAVDRRQDPQANRAFVQQLLRQVA